MERSWFAGAVALVALTVVCAGSWLHFSISRQSATVIRPPLLVSTEGDELRARGAWEIQSGYVPSGTGAIEIRCFKQIAVCVEAEANVQKHTEGEDLTAEARLYRITSWTNEAVVAMQFVTPIDCVQRSLDIKPTESGADQRWESLGMWSRTWLGEIDRRSYVGRVPRPWLSSGHKSELPVIVDSWRAFI